MSAAPFDVDEYRVTGTEIDDLLAVAHKLLNFDRLRFFKILAVCKDIVETHETAIRQKSWHEDSLREKRHLVLNAFDEAVRADDVNHFMEHVLGLSWQDWPASVFRAIAEAVLTQMPSDDLNSVVDYARSYLEELNEVAGDHEREIDAQHAKEN